MDFKIDSTLEKHEPIEIMIGVPVSMKLKTQLDALKKVCGKEVNKKAREFFESLVKENKDKIEKAG